MHAHSHKNSFQLLCLSSLHICLMKHQSTNKYLSYKMTPFDSIWHCMSKAGKSRVVDPISICYTVYRRVPQIVYSLIHFKRMIKSYNSRTAVSGSRSILFLYSCDIRRATKILQSEISNVTLPFWHHNCTKTECFYYRWLLFENCSILSFF